jgi:hypothetical protein
MYDPTRAHNSDAYCCLPPDVAIAAGIHDPEKRAQFVAAVNARQSMPVSMLFEFGGMRPPKIALLRPLRPAYPQVHEVGGMPVEAWVDRIMDCSQWDERADGFEDIFGACLSNLPDLPGFVNAVALSIMLAATLEHVGEAEIDCLEAAAYYALCAHPEWRQAGLEWLQPVRATWFRDWTKRRPQFASFARMCRDADATLPAWIDGSHA